ncbi:MAG: hypothetical protein ACI39W_00420 [Brotaphodocola sp.]
MTERELKKLSRADLLEMLIDQSKQLQDTQKKLAEAEDKLCSREIMLQQAGSIAEASIQINGVFEAAQAASQQYLDNVRQLSERQKLICEKLEQESREKAQQRIQEAEEKSRSMEEITMKKCQDMESETTERCNTMLTKAREESEAYWKDVSQRLDDFYSKYSGLRELLSMTIPR